MADVFSKAKRSEVMSQIRSRGNRRTELALKKLLREHRIVGWRRHQGLTGRPDFVFFSSRVAIFVDGCFWHGCKDHAHIPKTNRNYWIKKLIRNRKRDSEVGRVLRKNGWRILRIWEHDLKAKKVNHVLLRIRRTLSMGRSARGQE